MAVEDEDLAGCVGFILVGFILVGFILVGVVELEGSEKLLVG